MKYSSSVLFFGFAALASGCQDGGPYEVGLLVKSTASVRSVSKSYREVAGSEVAESMGAIGYGERCSTAMLSSGDYTSVWTGEMQINMEVVGETKVPRLVPDDTHEQEDVWISLVMETTRSGGSSSAIVNYNYPEDDPSSLSEVVYTDNAIETDVAYYGVTAEDYVAAFALSSLWPSDDTGLDPNAATLLTKHNPQEGDVWFSQNGNSVYMFSGMEDMTVGGAKLSVAKVLVYEAGDVDVTGGIMDTCINQGRDQYDTSLSEGDYDDEVALLDAGCDSSFRHVQTGTQWWSDGVLVKAEVENVDVTITDFGWEWYRSTESSCSRETSTRRPNSEAKMYIEYDVTTTTYAGGATDWVAP
jgi:hypothetical protein